MHSPSMSRMSQAEIGDFSQLQYRKIADIHFYLRQGQKTTSNCEHYHGPL